MAGFWKIDKTWVQEWGLTGNEAIFLADLITWPECGVGERAERINVSRPTLYALRRNLDKKCKETLQTECKETLQKVLRNFTIRCKETLQSDVKKLYTHTKIEEHIEEHKEEREEARAREEELETLGEVEKVEKLAGELRGELEAGSMTSERFQRSYGLTPEQVEQALGLFEDKLAIEGVTVKSRGDFRRHFNNWLKINAKTIFNDGNNNSSHKYQSKYSAEYMAGIVADITSGE